MFFCKFIYLFVCYCVFFRFVFCVFFMFLIVFFCLFLNENLFLFFGFVFSVFDVYFVFILCFLLWYDDWGMRVIWMDELIDEWIMVNGVVLLLSEWMDENRGSDLCEREFFGILKFLFFICGRVVLVLGVDDGDFVVLFYCFDFINCGFVIFK